MARTAIRNATCVLPEGLENVDVLIEDGVIRGVGAPTMVEADNVIDASGLHLLPGVIDDQVHFRDPGAPQKEDLFTGSKSAARGGVTTFLDMPNTDPSTTTVEMLHAKLDMASQKCLVNYGFYIGATSENATELAKAQRTPGIKIFIGSSTGNLLVDKQAALERIFAETTLPITAHCEDEETVQANAQSLGGGKSFEDHSKIRTPEAALIATRRAVDLATRHDHRFHVLHVSTALEAAFLADHRPLITAEACPHHLFFNIGDYARLGSLVQMNPSVKTKADAAALWKALHANHIQVVATDHAPHTLEEKNQPYPKSPSGVPAVENSLALMLNEVNAGRCTLEEVVAWMCDAPARTWDIIGKGRIVEGYDADLVLVDMNRVETIRNENQHTKCGWSPWHGTTLTGWPIRTFVHGREVYSDGTFDLDVRGREAQFDHARGGYWATA